MLFQIDTSAEENWQIEKNQTMSCKHKGYISHGQNIFTDVMQDILIVHILIIAYLKSIQLHQYWTLCVLD